MGTGSLLLAGLLAPVVAGAPISSTAAVHSGADEYAGERHNMVREQIEARGVRDARVLEAIRAVPRHLFVPSGMEHAAYLDSPLPIGEGQTISQPFIVGLMTEALATEPGQVVLEIGTGSGYQAAVLAALGCRVYTIEIVRALCRQAKRNLKKAGIRNVTVIHGDGWLGLPGKAPFDRIIVTAAPEVVPPRLIEQLKPSGRMVIPVGPERGDQRLLLVRKLADGRIETEEIERVIFVPMTGGED
jgi:protein-L-isoaspartate(D-aspartate) O-methyltransferase